HASAGGIHTSNLISESVVGRAVASTRQNAGNVIAFEALGGVNGPAWTAVADRIVIVGIVSAARFEHAVPLAAASAMSSPASGSSETRNPAMRRRVMGWPPSERADYTVRTTLPFT